MRYLCYFLHRHLDFRIPELLSLFELALLDVPAEPAEGSGGVSLKAGGYAGLPCARGRLGMPLGSSRDCPWVSERCTCSITDPTEDQCSRKLEECHGPRTNDGSIPGCTSLRSSTDWLHICSNPSHSGESSPEVWGAPANGVGCRPSFSLEATARPSSFAGPVSSQELAHDPNFVSRTASKSSISPWSSGGALAIHSKVERTQSSCSASHSGEKFGASSGQTPDITGRRTDVAPDRRPGGAVGSLEASVPMVSGEDTSVSDRRPLRWCKPPGDPIDSPFFFADFPSDAVAAYVARRSVLLKGVFEVWGEGLSWGELEASLRRFPAELAAPFLAPGSTFKIVVDGFGRVIPQAEQLEAMERLAFLPFKGKVDLRDPEHKFWLIQCCSAHPDWPAANNGLPPNLPPRIFFARQVACSDRTVLNKYELKSRTYLGPTAMDAELALLMANQALARRGSLIYDPFVGTGSILVAATHYGAVTMGADIDIRAIRDGRGPGRDVWANFRQYSLTPPVGLLRADNNCPPWRQGLCEVFHAIICDPPYGVRAGGRKSGGRKLLNGRLQPYTIPEELRENHIPSTAPYTLAECLLDLVDTAARLLTLGGRLVYFYPALREEHRDEDLPRHACLQLVGNSEQILTKRWSRRLITMEKVRRYTEGMQQEHAEVHARFREGHREAVEAAAEKLLGLGLRDAVFAPSERPAALHRDASMLGMGEEQRCQSQCSKANAGRPQYRGKCV